jgi:hypothetical protein
MTAVEFYRKHVMALVSTGKTEFNTEPEIFEQANKLFQNQIKNAHEDGFHSGQSMAHNGKSKFESPKDYYNKTFKQQEQ